MRQRVSRFSLIYSKTENLSGRQRQVNVEASRKC
jgi:hypothetical protein